MSPVALARAFACAVLALGATPSEARFLQVDPVGYKDQNNLYAYVNDDPLNATDPTGLDTVVQLQWYPLGSAPIIGTYGHQFVIMRDTVTGETVISRGGPDPAYNGGKFSAVSDSPSTGQNGQTSMLRTAMTAASQSVDAGQPGTKVVAGSTTTLKEPIGDAKSTLQKFNQAVDKANIPYTPQTQNSNAYAGTAYGVLTGRTAPSSTQLPGSAVNLKPQIPQCSSNPQVCGSK